MTAEITSSDHEQPESKGSIGSRAHHWINSMLPTRLRTILNGPSRVVQGPPAEAADSGRDTILVYVEATPKGQIACL